LKHVKKILQKTLVSHSTMSKQATNNTNMQQNEWEGNCSTRVQSHTAHSYVLLVCGVILSPIYT